MCNYKAETESVLQRDIFLFGLNDQTFILKIINEESPDVTATTIRQKLKKLEVGRRCQPSPKQRQPKRKRAKEERLA